MIEKKYNPKKIEQPLYRIWEKAGYFRLRDNPQKENFSIVMPPPNITGSLHIGHAFQQTIMDLIIRYRRMQGKNITFRSGIDHAGIATQIVIENKIFNEEKKTKHHYGKNNFIKKIWKWKKEAHNNINYQVRRLGISIDWTQERFTMDKEYEYAVKEAFIQLYQSGFIYRGMKLVNWDPKLSTAISDLEVEHRTRLGSMWYIRYPLINDSTEENQDDYIVVATTRPETILGDTAICVHPQDARYKSLLGKYVRVPIVDRIIPIIADNCVDVETGTGCMKVTPAHDFEDYKIGKRHALPMIRVISFSGKICHKAYIYDHKGKKSDSYSKDIPNPLKNTDRFSARKIIINFLKELGLIEKIEKYSIRVPYGDRSGVIIEPMLTHQWYVHMSPLVKKAVQVVKEDAITFVPEKYKSTYFSWMHNIEDWCISRQMWWGHRIPVWYDNIGNTYVGYNEDHVRQKYDIEKRTNLYQETDILDTWFSSSLWTFASLGWPKENTILNRFHPTDIMVSGFDIIFFWIARMIIMTTFLMKGKKVENIIPFKKVYITGLIKDEYGQKMSKSKGNVLDPLDMIDGVQLSSLLKKRTDSMMKPKLKESICKITKKKFPEGIKAYGADALRFTLIALSSNKRDISWDIKRLEGYRNFCNKLWNAGRFIIINLENKKYTLQQKKIIPCLIDRWIITELNTAINKYYLAVENYRFDLAANTLYEFIWNKFCNWYLEFSKYFLKFGSQEEIDSVCYTLINTLESTLRLAHPMMPFITETIWQDIKNVYRPNFLSQNNASIMIQTPPIVDRTYIDEQSIPKIEYLQKILINLRNIRKEMKVGNKYSLLLTVRSQNINSILNVKENIDFLKKMGYLSRIILSQEEKSNTSASITRIFENTQISVPINNIVDKEFEKSRIRKEIIQVEKEINYTAKKLANKEFVMHAPKNILVKSQKMLEHYTLLKIKLMETEKQLQD